METDLRGQDGVSEATKAYSSLPDLIQHQVATLGSYASSGVLILVPSQKRAEVYTVWGSGFTLSVPRLKELRWIIAEREVDSGAWSARLLPDDEVLRLAPQLAKGSLMGPADFQSSQVKSIA